MGTSLEIGLFGTHFHHYLYRNNVDLWVFFCLLWSWLDSKVAVVMTSVMYILPFEFARAMGNNSN